eukprot:TRINITY_DN10334_c0_g2_i2.p3 TRINITY_DN10334_c0_g2~~TRINITY_DN10334_c0_g2_i2.p3  ORF type:complete len:183 (+),score=23.33 TRINITY_DN10334_c0_g2_i2:37-549(+)
MATQTTRSPFGGAIGGHSLPADGKSQSAEKSQSQSVLKRQKKKAKKKRKQQLQSIVQETEPTPAQANGQPTTKAAKSSNGSRAKATILRKPWQGAPVETLQWLLGSIEPEVFFRDYWEKKPLCLRRKSPDYYQNVFSSQALDDIIRQVLTQYPLPWLSSCFKRSTYGCCT